MKKILALLNVTFGASFLLLASLIVIETLIRKLFNVSLQGVDELSGYVLAFGAMIAFAIAMLNNAHMRIDLFYRKFPEKTKSLLNILAVVLLMAFALFLFYVGFQVIQETRDYGSTAATPWATPLIYPQTFWLIGSALFALAALLQFYKITHLAIQKKWQTLNETFHATGTQDELADELQSHQRRQKLQPNIEPASPTQTSEGVNKP